MNLIFVQIQNNEIFLHSLSDMFLRSLSDAIIDLLVSGARWIIPTGCSERSADRVIGAIGAIGVIGVIGAIG